MPVRVSEITVRAAPNGLGRLLQDLRAGGFGPLPSASTSPSLATFCATAMPPLPFQIAPACPSSRCLATPQCEHDTASLEEAHALLACRLRLHEAEALV